MTVPAHSGAARARREGGFTLVETLIAIVLLGSLVGAVGTTLEIGLRTTSESGEQVNEAALVHILASWMFTDAQSAELVDTVDTCSPHDPGVEVQSFEWTVVAEDPPVTTHADWWQEGDQVMRELCVRTDGALAPGASQAIVDKRTESWAVDCDDDRCTITFVATPSAENSARTAEDRTYQMTVARRVAP